MIDLASPIQLMKETEAWTLTCLVSCLRTHSCDNLQNRERNGLSLAFSVCQFWQVVSTHDRRVTCISFHQGLHYLNLCLITSWDLNRPRLDFFSDLHLGCFSISSKSSIGSCWSFACFISLVISHGTLDSCAKLWLSNHHKLPQH